HLELEFFKSDNSLNNLITSHVEDISFFKLYAQNLLIAAILEHRIDLVDQKLSEKNFIDKQPTIPAINLVVPLPNFCTYGTDYKFWKEMLGRPLSNGFVEIQTPELYSSWTDIGALIMPTVTSIYWLLYGPPPQWAPSLACLFLDIKFLFFLRAFEYFGIFFAIIIGVAQKVFSYLIVLGMIILAFAHALYILLQEPSENLDSTDVNTDLYANFETSLLAVYLLMTGDNGSLSTWDYRANPILVLLMVSFSFFTVIYLLNLFIGLLSNAIGDYDNRAEYLIQKAEILIQIELFWLFPKQRRWQHWFPEYIYYIAHRDKVYSKIIEINNDNDLPDDAKPIISDELKKLAGINIESDKKLKAFSYT
ncbi:9704_t:CDS:2, partial [Ambispora leptoticha]